MKKISNAVKDCIYKAIGFLFLMTISTYFVYSQSVNINSPTLLTSDEISGIIKNNPKGNTYYYSFWANPGKLNLSLMVEHPTNTDNSALLSSVTVEVFDSANQKIETLLTTSAAIERRRVESVTVDVNNRQKLILSVKLHTYQSFGTGFMTGGKYKLSITGNAFSTNSNSTNESSDCFPCLPNEQNLTFPRYGFLSVIVSEGSLALNLNSVSRIILYDIPKRELKSSELKHGYLNLPNEGKIKIYLKNVQGVITVDLSKVTSAIINPKVEEYTELLKIK